MAWLVFLGLVLGTVGFCLIITYLEEKLLKKLPKIIIELPSFHLFRLVIPAMVSTLIIRYTLGFPPIDYNFTGMIIFLSLNIADGAITYYAVKELGLQEVNVALAPSPNTKIWDILLTKFALVVLFLLLWEDSSIQFKFFLLNMSNWIVFQNIFQILKTKRASRK